MVKENSNMDKSKDSKIAKSSYWTPTQKDGKIKEAILAETHTREVWPKRWGFMLDYWKSFDECSQKFGLTKERVQELNRLRRKPPSIQHQYHKIQIATYPKTTSGVIGWHSVNSSNKGLEQIGGPQYISPKSTFCPLTETFFSKKHKQYILYVG